MEFFPIAALIVATFLLLIGIVGRGASMGSSQFHITLEGSIGRLPRVVILTVSILTYILAIVLFVYEADVQSTSGASPAANVTESQASAITLKFESGIPKGATSETDTIVIEDYDPLILKMDSSNNASANGSIYLDGQYSGVDVNYSVKVIIIESNGTEETYSGEGAITAGDDLAYSVQIYDDGSAGLEPS